MRFSKAARTREAFMSMVRAQGPLPTTMFASEKAPQRPGKVAVQTAQRLVGGLPMSAGETVLARVNRLASKLERLQELDRDWTNRKRAKNG
jgi:hypothetical protein